MCVLSGAGRGRGAAPEEQQVEGAGGAAEHQSGPQGPPHGHAPAEQHDGAVDSAQLHRTEEVPFAAGVPRRLWHPRELHSGTSAAPSPFSRLLFCCFGGAVYLPSCLHSLYSLDNKNRSGSCTNSSSPTSCAASRRTSRSPSRPRRRRSSRSS